MFGSEILEVAIGLILVFLLLSLVCSSMREGIEAFMKVRAVDLERGIRELLHDRKGTGLARDVYGHPLVNSLYQGEYDPRRIDASTGRMRRGTALPSYIPASNFALALLDIVARGPSVADPKSAGAGTPLLTLDGVRASVEQIGNPPVQRALLAAIDAANGDLARAQANIEAWFNSAMDRVSGWYKRRTQNIIFALGVVVTVALNANSLAIARRLYFNDAARDALVAQAEAIARDTTLRARDVPAPFTQLQRLDLPLGWDGVEFGAPWVLGWWDSLFSPLLGWLITALAIALGAPFWFDFLNKFMVIRSTVKPHEKSPEEASEDRQRPASRMPPALGATAAAPAAPGAPSAAAAPVMAPATPAVAFEQEWAAGDPQEGRL